MSRRLLSIKLPSKLTEDEQHSPRTIQFSDNLLPRGFYCPFSVLALCHFICRGILFSSRLLLSAVLICFAAHTHSVREVPRPVSARWRLIFLSRLPEMQLGFLYLSYPSPMSSPRSSRQILHSRLRRTRTRLPGRR